MLDFSYTKPFGELLYIDVSFLLFKNQIPKGYDGVVLRKNRQLLELAKEENVDWTSSFTGEEDEFWDWDYLLEEFELWKEVQKD